MANSLSTERKRAQELTPPPTTPSKRQKLEGDNSHYAEKVKKLQLELQKAEANRQNSIRELKALDKKEANLEHIHGCLKKVQKDAEEKENEIKK